MKGRRRLSSDGLKLFNMALIAYPRPNKVRELLGCMFRSEYDDRLDEMVSKCREAAAQLYAYTHYKDVNVNKLINNSILNIITSVIMDDNQIAKRQVIRRNFQYFMDVALRSSHENDHNTAILIHAALTHPSIGQLKLKLRKRDRETLALFENMYGTLRDNHSKHFKDTMVNTDYEDCFPSLMVLKIHHARHSTYSSFEKVKLRHQPHEIQSKIGMFAMHHPHTGDKMPLYESPIIEKSTDLILLAQSVK